MQWKTATQYAPPRTRHLFRQPLLASGLESGIGDVGVIQRAVLGAMPSDFHSEANCQHKVKCAQHNGDSERRLTLPDAERGIEAGRNAECGGTDADQLLVRQVGICVHPVSSLVIAERAEKGSQIWMR